MLLQLNYQRISLIRSQGSRRIILRNRPRIHRHLHLSTLYYISRRGNPLTNNRTTKCLMNRISIPQDISRIRRMNTIINNDRQRTCNLQLSNSPTLTLGVRPVRMLHARKAIISSANSLRRTINRNQLTIISIHSSTRITRNVNQDITQNQNKAQKYHRIPVIPHYQRPANQKSRTSHCTKGLTIPHYLLSADAKSNAFHPLEQAGQEAMQRHNWRRIPSRTRRSRWRNTQTWRNNRRFTTSHSPTNTQDTN